MVRKRGLCSSLVFMSVTFFQDFLQEPCYCSFEIIQEEDGDSLSDILSSGRGAECGLREGEGGRQDCEASQPSGIQRYYNKELRAGVWY